MNNNTLKRSILTTVTLLTLTSFGSLAWAFPPHGSPVDRMDTDGDGLVSANEFNPPGIMRERLDADDDGVITRNELDAQITAMKAEMAERQTKMFARMQANFDASDTDGDGMVTQTEAQSAAFARIDTDGDGYLSREEFIAHRPAHAPQHGPERGNGKPDGRPVRGS